MYLLGVLPPGSENKRAWRVCEHEDGNAVPSTPDQCPVWYGIYPRLYSLSRASHDFKGKYMSEILLPIGASKRGWWSDVTAAKLLVIYKRV